MFEVSWGELIVLTGVGFALIGKKDLPRVAGVVGNRVGRIVGLLQGARARADKFAQQSELKQLHNELKSGLRELDAVKSEMAVAMSSRGMRGLGGASSTITRTVLSSSHQAGSSLSPTPPSATAAPAMGRSSSNSSPVSTIQQIPAALPSPTALPPELQTIGAVAEDEWMKQGIGFQSRAERGVGLGYSDEDANNPLNSGSSILANIYKQNLIFDQYDRVQMQQDSALKSKIDEIEAKRQQDGEDKKEQ